MKKLAVLVLLVSAGCQPFFHRRTEIVRIAGSDTMYILASRWAEEYMRLHPNISIYVEGGGTKKGVEAMIDGRADICTASRPLRASEARLLTEKYRRIGISHLVAKDALSVYVNPENPVQNLSREQLKSIFTGEITRWSEVGGRDELILVIIRSPNSGTFQYFKEHLLEDQAYAATAVSATTTEAVVQAVRQNSNAVGYGGAVYGPQLVHCRIDGIAPTKENVGNDSYPIIRYLYFYTADSPHGAVKTFIDWVLKEGQKTVEEVGYFPLWRVP